MSVVYDNWERLVRATLRREQLRLTGLRTPSDLSSLSSASPSFNFSYESGGQLPSFNFWSLLVGDSFTYHQILEATDFLSDFNLIKNGHSGDLYYGVLGNGIQVVVKKINLSSMERELYFMSELEICGMVNHSRLIPFLGYCLENAYEKFLVYKYTPNKDLSSQFQREIVSDAGGNRWLPSLDWATRLKIATGAAEGLCYLHHECFPPLVHRDIQASSILLDDDFEVRLGSLTEVCIQEKNDKQNSIARFLRLPKGFQKSTSGTSNAACAYDVFCFGKVLLELVSGKLGISYVSDSIMKDWVANTLRYVIPDDKKFVLKIVDPSLPIDDHLLLEVWLVTFVAKACLSLKPSKRPEMAEVLKALEYTKSARLCTHGNVHSAGHPNSVSPASPMIKAPEGSKLMGWILQVMTDTTSSDSNAFSGNNGFLEAIGGESANLNGNILASPSLRIFTYSELQDATKNFRTEALLGQGEFGKVYKGSINEKSKSKKGSASLVAVRKLHSLTRVQRSQGWQVNLLGRLSHHNLVKLLGFCMEDNDNFFVYEFMKKASLDHHLFRRGSSVQPLPWDPRLRILTGAARGLEFLHALQEQGFFNQKCKGEGFYDFFKPSKILLDDDYNAKISGFDMGQIDFTLIDSDIEPHPIKYERGRYVYVARERFFEGQSSLKSDVYGFGVVLVQILTGRDVYHPTLSKHGLDLKWLLNFQKLSVTTRGELEKIMDPGLEGKYPSKPAKKMAKLAQLCLHYVPECRPSMKQVVDILEHIESANEIPKQPRMNSSS